MGSADALADALLKAVGENDGATEPQYWLDLGYPPLNSVISGRYDRGLPGGRIIEIYGPSASGKTVLATQAMKSAQRAGGLGVFVDWERTFNSDFARKLGLNTDFPHFIYKRSETWEEGNTVAMKVAEAARSKKLLPDEAPIVVVFDSIAAAVPKSMLYDKDGNRRPVDEYTMNDTTALARVTSTTLKAINQLVAEFNVTAIYLNQIRVKPGVVWGDPTTTPGGSAMEFYATTRLALGAKKIMEKGADGKEFKGRTIGIEAKKNKVNRPFQSTDIDLIYDAEGIAKFDFVGGMIDHLINIGKLTQTGPRVSWTDGKSYFKSQLAEALTKANAYDELVKMLPTT